MKIILNNEQTKNKELVYEETLWFEKKILKYNGVFLNKVKRNLYEYNDGKKIEQVEVNGNHIIGITIKIFNNKIEVLRKITWYEIVMSLCILIPCLLFGAVGGAIGGAISYMNIVIIRNIDKWWMKLIISIELAIICFLLIYIFSILLMKAFNILI